MSQFLSDSFLNRPATLFLDSSSLWPVRKKRKPERWRDTTALAQVRHHDGTVATAKRKATVNPSSMCFEPVERKERSSCCRDFDEGNRNHKDNLRDPLHNSINSLLQPWNRMPEEETEGTRHAKSCQQAVITSDLR